MKKSGQNVLVNCAFLVSELNFIKIHIVLDSTYSESPILATTQSDSNDFIVPIHGATSSNPQLIPPHSSSIHQTDGSNPSSTSTTPVSDTTATEMDRSEAMAKDSTQQDPVASNDEQSAE